MTTTRDGRFWIIDGVRYTAEQIFDDQGLYDRVIADGHADKYPNGCRETGHHCDACLARLGQTAHVVASRRVGARRGYYGTVEYRCTEPGCRADV